MINKKQIVKQFFKAESEMERKELLNHVKANYVRDCYILFPVAFQMLKKMGNLIEGKDYEFDEKENKYLIFFD